MDTLQSAEIRLRLVGDGAPSVASQFTLNLRPSAAGGNIFTAGAPYVNVQSPVPAGVNILVVQNFPVPASTILAAQQVRQKITRDGSVDTYNGSVYLIGATLLYACR